MKLNNGIDYSLPPTERDNAIYKYLWACPEKCQSEKNYPATASWTVIDMLGGKRYYLVCTECGCSSDTFSLEELMNKPKVVKKEEK